MQNPFFWLFETYSALLLSVVTLLCNSTGASFSCVTVSQLAYTCANLSPSLSTSFSPQLWHPPFYSHFLWDQLFVIPHQSEIVWHLSFI
jgi:hypothetical protein